MIILDSTKSIKAALAGAVTTNQLPIVASYVDIAAPDTYEPATSHVVTSGAADVTPVASPAASKKRQLKYLSIVNDDTAVATVTVKLDDGGTLRNLFKVAALPVGGAIIYTDGEGFRVFAASGALL